MLIQIGVTKKAFKALRRASQKTDVSWPCVLNFHIFKLQKKVSAQEEGFSLYSCLVLWCFLVEGGKAALTCRCLMGRGTQ